MTTRASVIAPIAVATATAAGFVAAAAWWAPGGAAVDATPGAALYDGRQPLVARIRGHEDALPPAAARCANCHEGAQAIAPALDARTLAQPVARRGGPPSRYDAKTLCRLLRDGVDPAWVVVPREMPRYQIDDAACEALWTHLSGR